MSRAHSYSHSRAHSPNFQLLHLRHSSFWFSTLSVNSPTSQLILQPFPRFTYVTTHSPTLPLLHLRHSSFSNPCFASPKSQDFHLRHLASRPCNVNSCVWHDNARCAHRAQFVKKTNLGINSTTTKFNRHAPLWFRLVFSDKTIIAAWHSLSMKTTFLKYVTPRVTKTNRVIWTRQVKSSRQLNPLSHPPLVQKTSFVM